MKIAQTEIISGFLEERILEGEAVLDFEFVEEDLSRRCCLVLLHGECALLYVKVLVLFGEQVRNDSELGVVGELLGVNIGMIEIQLARIVRVAVHEVAGWMVMPVYIAEYLNFSLLLNHFSQCFRSIDDRA